MVDIWIFVKIPGGDGGILRKCPSSTSQVWIMLSQNYSASSWWIHAVLPSNPNSLKQITVLQKLASLLWAWLKFITFYVGILWSACQWNEGGIFSAQFKFKTFFPFAFCFINCTPFSMKYIHAHPRCLGQEGHHKKYQYQDMEAFFRWNWMVFKISTGSPFLVVDYFVSLRV